MKKWVIKRSPSGNLSVWEYIESEAEASQYWWVDQAIRKWGASKILPIAMNECGGYHHCKPDDEDVVQIIESETEPILSVYKQYKVNDPKIAHGWMAPDGTTFSCEWMGHMGLARKLCGQLHVTQKPSNHEDDDLLAAGWIKISEGKWYGDWDKINDTQVRKLESLDMKHLGGADDDFIQRALSRRK